jgi:hypothetical protein
MIEMTSVVINFYQVNNSTIIKETAKSDTESIYFTLPINTYVSTL